MSTLVDNVKTVTYDNGFIIIHMSSDIEIKFPVKDNPRLARGTPEQLQHIEISPYGLHWPDLDEDLSLRGLLAGDFGQYAGVQTRHCT